MNRNKLKTYAPEARRDFIQAMIDRAAFFGLTAKKVEHVVVRGDVAVIAGRDYPRAVADKRQKLEARIAREGFEQTMEAMAYTWFNRLVAIRFMELHGYLDHGYRVLSHPEGKPTPEILEHPEHVDLPGLKKDRVIDLKLDGNKESDLYRLLLTAQCNALHKAMPFLFERIDDETELLLPANLLHSDSLVRKLVDGIDEDDWKEVEIIGWLYQFYISEKKDEVIGKVVASADIPAATQLFTPKWIVKYLVQNTLGRQWLATYPNSSLRAQMDFYIEPSQQPTEVKDALKAITPTSLNPEELTMLDPACGSCHILVEGYDLFKSIYLERGYRLKDIPALILRKNLFGLEIDDRAAQLGAFALMMKARADDRRIFEGDAKPNVLSFQETKGIDPGAMVSALNAPTRNGNSREYLFEEIDDAETPLLTRKSKDEAPISVTDLETLLVLFRDAKTFGSLCKVPAAVEEKLSALENRLHDVLMHGDLVHATALVLKPILQQVRLLAQQYDVVVANPPYMGSKYYSSSLKAFVKQAYKSAKSDLYACFMQRNACFAKAHAYIGMVTIPNWMFLSSFEDVRRLLFEQQSIETFIDNGRGVFGSDFGSCSFVLRNSRLLDYRGSYRRLFTKQGSVTSNEELAERFKKAETFTPSNADFTKIAGSPIAYWASPKIRQAFAERPPLKDLCIARHGMSTSDNDRFLRLWHEVGIDQVGFGYHSREDARASKKRWFPFNKGGSFRRWYGNNEYVVNWENDGEEIKEVSNLKYPYLKGNLDFVIGAQEFYFREAITWSSISIGSPSFRFSSSGFVIGNKGQCLFPNSSSDMMSMLSLLNSSLSLEFLRILSPSVGFELGYVQLIPTNIDIALVGKNASRMVEIAIADWDASELSWDFQLIAVVCHGDKTSLEQSQEAADVEVLDRFRRMKELEEENNRLVIDAYDLQGEVSSDVSDDQISLYRPDRAEDMRRLLSYVVGCALGRYSLGAPGIVYAKGDNKDFDARQYTTFRASADAILTVLDADWGFVDDVTHRVVDFISTGWPNGNVEKNLRFISESLGGSGEEPRTAIRRYFGSGFYKHHLSTYRRRPIYWLFSSGKQRAFQCLVYLHRYNGGTLARMRTEYVIPLQSKMIARIDQLEADKAQAASTSTRKKHQKEQEDLKKKVAELAVFEEKLKHFADQQISIDLDDGVKTNYGKFGDLLAEVKAVTGGKDEE